MNKSKILSNIYIVLILICTSVAGIAGFLGLQGLTCGASCDVAFNSEYSKIFNIPVGIYALFLWIYIGYRGISRITVYLLALMAIGACTFLSILFFVLHGSCPICLAHNIPTIFAAIVGIYLYKTGKTIDTNKSILFLLVVLPLISYIIYSKYTEEPNTENKARSTTTLYTPILSERDYIDTGIIISINCKYCYEVLGDILAYPKGNKIALLFKGTSENMQASVQTLASIYALHKQDKFKDIQKAYLQVVPLMYKYREKLIKNDYTEYLNELSRRVKVDTQSEALAKYVISTNSIYYLALKTQQTPIVIKNGKHIFKRTEMFPEKIFSRDNK